jgi:hypothetical protein
MIRQITRVFLGLFFIILAGILPSTAKAATFYLDPPQQTIGPNDVIEVKVKIGVANNECINAAQVGIDFPSDILQLTDFNSGDSFLSIWVQKPDQASLAQINNDGKIVFSGGIPGGYCGVIPGDPGDSNILGSLIFTPKKPIVFHKAKLDFDSVTQAFVNDGNGTPVVINTQGSVLQIDESIATQSDTWAAQIAADKTPPEPFVIEIDNSPRVAGGKYFLVFSTVDKQTGVDHYEVLEAKAADLGEQNPTIFSQFLTKIFGAKQPAKLVWVKSDSPYILKDQSLKSVIRVKAVDRAGNERVVEYDNAALQVINHSRPIDWRPIIIGGLGLLVLLFILVPVIIHLRRKKGRIDLG